MQVGKKFKINIVIIGIIVALICFFLLQQQYLSVNKKNWQLATPTLQLLSNLKFPLYLN